jgi:hypothetical protein
VAHEQAGLPVTLTCRTQHCAVDADEMHIRYWASYNIDMARQNPPEVVVSASKVLPVHAKILTETASDGEDDSPAFELCKV